MSLGLEVGQRHEASRQPGHVRRPLRGPKLPGAGVPRFLQRRALEADAPHSPLEREADAMAEQMAAPPIVHEVLRSPGQPLDSATRRYVEPRFGHDFSQVRVHADAKEAQSARAVNASAYTVGNHVVLGAGQPASATSNGLHTLAHELAHVVQQERGAPSPPLHGGMLEQAADAAASAFIAGRGPIHVAGASAPGLARQPLSGTPAAGNLAAVPALAGGDVTRAMEDLVGQDPIDTLDAFLTSRLALFTVDLVGLKVLVSIDKTSSWRKRYTRGALSQAALAAALNAMHGVKVDTGVLQTAYAAAIADGSIKLQQTPKEDPERFWIYIDEPALDKMAGRVQLAPDATTASWERRFALAKMLAFGVDEIGGALGSLSDYLSEQKLSQNHLTLATITYLFTERRETVVEIAKTHKATAAWRAAFNADPDLAAGRRDPAFTDFPHASPEQWADLAITLAVAARATINEANTKERERQRKQGVNDYLSPHEVKADNAAKFIADHFDDQAAVTLQPMGWALHGGETWTDIKGAEIFILGVANGYVFYQHVATTHFFQQTVDGFAQEQLYSIYAEAGRKSLGAIKLTRFILSLAGDIFPVVRYGLIATEVLTILDRLHRYESQLKAAYAEFATAYRNVDEMLDDLLPSLFSAEHLKIFNPLDHPDWVGWARSVLRFVLQIAASKGAAAISMMDEMVFGVVTSIWKTVGKGLMAVVHAASVMFPAVSSSAGAATPADAVEHAKRLITDAGVGGAERLTRAMMSLPPADQQRLAREVQALMEGGTQLIDQLAKVVQW